MNDWQYAYQKLREEFERVVKERDMYRKEMERLNNEITTLIGIMKRDGRQQSQ